MHSHEFLFEPGTWRIVGTYYDEQDQGVLISGRRVILQEEEKWILEEEINQNRPDSAKVSRQFIIKTFQLGQDWTTFYCQDQQWGTLKGKILLFDESLILFWESEEGNYSCMEYLKQDDLHSYAVSGYVFQEDKKIASWDGNMVLEAIHR